MKHKMYDYSGFRLSRILEPRFIHVLLVLDWPLYLLMYFLTEKYIPLERCHLVHCWLDDVIPFNEYFLIAYCFWYVLLFCTLLYFLLFDVESFKSLQIYIFITQVVATAIYIIWPSVQDLRPETFAHDNLLTRVMAGIYSADTSTGVCPSLHVAYSLGIASAWLKKKDAHWAVRTFVVIAVILICISVCFVKQHSALDVLAALPVCLLAELLVYWKSWWKPRLTRQKTAV